MSFPFFWESQALYKQVSFSFLPREKIFEVDSIKGKCLALSCPVSFVVKQGTEPGSLLSKLNYLIAILAFMKHLRSPF